MIDVSRRQNVSPITNLASWISPGGNIIEDPHEHARYVAKSRISRQYTTSAAPSGKIVASGTDTGRAVIGAARDHAFRHARLMTSRLVIYNSHASPASDSASRLLTICHPMI